MLYFCYISLNSRPKIGGNVLTIFLLKEFWKKKEKSQNNKQFGVNNAVAEIAQINNYDKIFMMYDLWRFFFRILDYWILKHINYNKTITTLLKIPQREEGRICPSLGFKALKKKKEIYSVKVLERYKVKSEGLSCQVEYASRILLYEIFYMHQDLHHSTLHRSD